MFFNLNDLDLPEKCKSETSKIKIPYRKQSFFQFAASLAVDQAPAFLYHDHAGHDHPGLLWGGTFGH
jgi:hypothetical protein